MIIVILILDNMRGPPMGMVVQDNFFLQTQSTKEYAKSQILIIVKLWCGKLM